MLLEPRNFDTRVDVLRVCASSPGGEDPSGEGQVSVPAGGKAAPEPHQARQHHRCRQPGAGRGPPPGRAAGQGAHAHPDPRAEGPAGPAAAAGGRPLHVHPSRPGGLAAHETTQ